MTKTISRHTAALLVIVLAAMAPSLAAHGQTIDPASTDAADRAAEADWGSYGIQTGNIDPTVRPGDDFNAHVNGGWEKRSEIPADKTRLGTFIELRELSDDRMHAILTGLVAAHPAPGSAKARIADAYTAFMDSEAIESAGLAPARPMLDRIAAARDLGDVITLFATPGLPSPVGLFVDPDAKQSDRYALQIVQSGLGLPDRDYYLSNDAKHAGIRGKYHDYLSFMLGQAGYAEPKGAARKVLALETALARATWDRSIERNVDLTYNRVERKALDRLDRKRIMARLLHAAVGRAADYAIVYQLPPTPGELAAAGLTPDPARLGGGMPETLAIVGRTPVATWRAWLAAHFLGNNAQFLPAAIDEARFAFVGTVLSGQRAQKERWRRGIAVVEVQIGELLGQIYAEHHFPAQNRAAMDGLVANLRQAMAANLSDLSWMGADTRKQAEAKLASFTAKIGAPPVWKDYEGLVIRADAPLANQLAAQEWATRFHFGRIGKPVDRIEWVMLPQTVNAYYNPSFNEIVFPAAILQPPFFNLSADPAVNYGAIGAVIGHEMGHGFDDQGAKMDGTGNLRDWWTPADKANFEKLQDRLAAQFARFCPFDGGKTCVNGRLTMGENIGDLGGLSLALRAYRLSLGGKPAPVIDGTTGDQRFFMAWAQVWRASMREEQARQFLLTDPHSPPRYRINGVVRNFDEWHAAFNVQPGDALYLPPEERVRIW